MQEIQIDIEPAKRAAKRGVLTLSTFSPGSASSAGSTGNMCWDANYIYVCVATNTWKRAALSTW